jgi:hypothetical protein
MSEQAGPSVAALQARQSALASRHGTAADADRVLADVLATAHAVTRESVRRLDAIAEQIDRAVLDRAALAVDTPMGAREFHNFLAAKLHEIKAIVTEAHELGHTKKVVLESLRAQYAGPGG